MTDPTTRRAEQLLADLDTARRELREELRDARGALGDLHREIKAARHHGHPTPHTPAWAGVGPTLIHARSTRRTAR